VDTNPSDCRKTVPTGKPTGRTSQYMDVDPGGKRFSSRLAQHHPQKMDDNSAPGEFAGRLEDAGHLVLGEAITRVPNTRESQNPAHRFRQHGESYLRFITTPGIDPTNSVAKQAIRFVVIDRKVTQRTRSEWGRRWLERIWTVIATCRQQGRSPFTFLSSTVTAWLGGLSPPRLLPPSQ